MTMKMPCATMDAADTSFSDDSDHGSHGCGALRYKTVQAERLIPLWLTPADRPDVSLTELVQAQKQYAIPCAQFHTLTLTLFNIMFKTMSGR